MTKVTRGSWLQEDHLAIPAIYSKLLIDIPYRHSILPVFDGPSGMNHSLFGQEQTRKVKTRFRMLQHDQKTSHNVSRTRRFFGISCARYYIGHRRFQKHGMEYLPDRSRWPTVIRFRIPRRRSHSPSASARSAAAAPCA